MFRGVIEILTFHCANAPTHTAMNVRLRFPGVLTNADQRTSDAMLSISIVRAISAISNWIRGWEASSPV